MGSSQLNRDETFGGDETSIAIDDCSATELQLEGQILFPMQDEVGAALMAAVETGDAQGITF